MITSAVEYKVIQNSDSCLNSNVGELLAEPPPEDLAVKYRKLARLYPEITYAMYRIQGGDFLRKTFK